MFGPGESGLVRPVEDERRQLRRVVSRLREGGIAATHSTADDDPPGLLRRLRDTYGEGFPHRLSLTPACGANVVLVGSSRPLDARLLRDAPEVGCPLARAALRRVEVGA